MKEKQIEEMAKICCNTCEFGCGFNGECDLDTDYRTCGVTKETAEHLYNAGYRKASEVAREIFEEIERETKNHGICYTQRKIAELKKKYTEGICETH